MLLGWAGWAVMHSLLVSPGWQRSFFRRFPCLRPWYRLGYNVLAVATLIPLLLYKHALAGPVLLVWPWWLAPVRWFLLACALWLAWAGCRVYDLGWVGGWKHLGSGCSYADDACAGELKTDGILGRVRHPWYTAALFFLWSRVECYDAAELVTSVALSLYVVAGAHLEERRLVATYGETYRAYQAAVPMFFPRYFPRSTRGS